MTDSTLSEKKPNRRIAARIYEQSNLFYQKIDNSPQTQPSFGSLLQDSPSEMSLPPDHTLPASQSQENDTLNVNISATGIAFTCTEALQAGDRLLLRILLLSNMTVIMTSCRVVYCKASNPYETDRYPYLVGTEFINMTAEDNALLHQHVRRKQQQQWILNGSLLTLLTVILLYPLEVLHLAMELSHYLLEILLHGLYLGFEYSEMGLDHVIEHLFHTGLHQTQVIVFYILVSCALIALYFIARRLPALCMRAINQQLLFWSRKKASILYYWGEQTLVEKMRIIGLSCAVILGYFFFLL